MLEAMSFTLVETDRVEYDCSVEAAAISVLRCVVWLIPPTADYISFMATVIHAQPDCRIVMLGFVILVCGAARWVFQSKVMKPLHSLALRLQDIAEGEDDLTHRIEDIVPA
jgi:hypothetical protein